MGSSEQEMLADAIVKDYPIPDDVLVARERNGKPRSKDERSVFPWKTMIDNVRKKFASSDLLSRRTRLDRAHFSYAKDGETVELNWEGLCLQFKETDDEVPAIQNGIKERIDKQLSLLPQLKANVKLQNRTNSVTTPGSPVRAIQEEIVKDKLDAVPITDATFATHAKLVISATSN